MVRIKCVYVTGCVWVYGSYNLCSNEESLLSYCSLVIYWFSFWLIIGAMIVTFVLILLMFIVFVCMVRRDDDHEIDN